MLVNSKEILNTARERGCGLPAPDYYDFDSARSYVRTAERLGLPLILSYAQVFDSFFPLEDAAEIGLYFAKKASVPVALHLDHGTTEDFIEKAVRLGFSSVMIDASTDEFERNISRTRQIVQLAHPLGITVEAEIGHVGSGTEEDDNAVYTEVGEAVTFAEETGVDSLAVSIGTAHGIYKKFAPVLNFERLSELAASAQVPLVLHGGSGTGDANIAECVRRGICKINVYTEFLLAAKGALQENSEKDLPAMKEAAAEAMSKVLEHYYGICGSYQMK